MPDTRLIERWLPISALGIESSSDGRRDLLDVAEPRPATADRGPVTITCKSGDNLDHLARAGLDREPRFFAALEAVLEILPPSKTFTGIALEGAVEASGSDFEALYNLYRLAYDDRIDEPDQLRLWHEEG